MKKYILLTLYICILISCSKSDRTNVNIINPNKVTSFTDSVNYLALGDSYTIGTSIDIVDGYPKQTFELLKGAEFKMNSLQIIAKNGWTAGDLKNALASADKKSVYHIVTILIGVNNQYQGKPINEFETSFLSGMSELLLYKSTKLF